MNAMVAERERYRLFVDAGVVPASAWTSLERAEELVEQANAALRQAQDEVAKVHARAREEGLAEGNRSGMQQWAAAVHALVAARATATADLRRRAGDIAIGVVRHIAPAIGAERLVATLVGEAMQKLVFEPHLLVRVHPEVAEQARAEVAALGAAAPPDTEIIGDPELDLFDCVIESAGGVVRAGLNEQLDQVRVILAAAEQASGESHGQHA